MNKLPFDNGQRCQATFNAGRRPQPHACILTSEVCDMAPGLATSDQGPVALLATYLTRIAPLRLLPEICLIAYAKVST